MQEQTQTNSQATDEGVRLNQLLTSAENAILQKDTVRARAMLTEYTGNPQAPDIKRARHLLRELEVATSDADAIDLLSNLPASMLAQFQTKRSLPEIERLQTPALREIYAAMLRKHLPRELARREDVAKREEAERRLAKLEDQQRKLKEDQLAQAETTRKDKETMDEKARQEETAKRDLERKEAEKKRLADERKLLLSAEADRRIKLFYLQVTPLEKTALVQAEELMRTIQSLYMNGTLDRNSVAVLATRSSAASWAIARAYLTVGGDYIPPESAKAISFQEAWNAAPGADLLASRAEDAVRQLVQKLREGGARVSENPIVAVPKPAANLKAYKFTIRVKDGSKGFKEVPDIVQATSSAEAERIVRGRHVNIINVFFDGEIK